MKFASRISRSPRPFDPDRGAEARDLFPDLPAEVLQVIEGTAGCAPYLKTLMEKEHAWLTPALDNPEEAVVALFAEARKLRTRIVSFEHGTSVQSRIQFWRTVAV